MKGLAKFLSFLLLLAYIVLILGTALVVVVAVLLFIGLDISFINQALDSGAITLSGLGAENLTPEKLAEFKMPVTLTLIGTVISLLLSLRSVRMVRRALKQVGQGTPFSTITVKALRQAAILFLISAVVSVVFPVIAYVMFSKLLGTQITFTATSFFAYLFDSLVLFLLSGVAKFGNQYVPDEEVLPPPVGNPYGDTDEY